MDIFQNSIRAGASFISLDVIENIHDNFMKIEITDNGCGMTKEMVQNVTDPFFTTRTTRKVGLGLSLLRQNAERTGGVMSISSEPGKGTTVTATFVYDNIDRPVLGDVPGAVILTATANPGIRFIYHHVKDNKSFTFDTLEVKKEIGENSFESPELYSALKEYIVENLKELKVDLDS
ncbi:MAG: ATP-binding protein [Bacteroidota bacterium]|nr:ATP-binding protein [Bacteroidota bacterium]